MTRLIRFFFLALVLLGAVRAPFDWSEDATWELSQGKATFRLGLAWPEVADLPAEQEMVVLPIGLLVRRQANRVVNLTVLQGEWSLLRNSQPLGRVGDSLEQWQNQLGLPKARYGNPEKMGIIQYYQASLADVGLMVSQEQVQSVMLVEPGYLVPALERTGYSVLP